MDKLAITGGRRLEGMPDGPVEVVNLMGRTGRVTLAMAIAAAGGLTPAPAGPLPSITAFKDEPPPADPMRLQLSRNFMANTINAFCGSLGNSALLERLEAAHSLADLRLCFDEWYQAIVTSRDGRREAEALRSKLLDTI